MGASATACPICAAPALVGDDEVIDLTDTATAPADDPVTAEQPAATENASTPAAPEHEMVHSGAPELRRRSERARDLGTVPSAPPGRTRPKTPLPPYVPPTPPADTTSAGTADGTGPEHEPPALPAERAAGPTVTPPPAPPSAPRQPDLPPALLEPAPLPPPPAPSSASPWTAPPGAAWPGPAPATTSATAAGAHAATTADASPSRRRPRAVTRALLVLLVVMVAVGIWLQWDRITEVFDRAGDESSLVTEAGGDPAQAPVVEGRFDRNVGSVVTHTTLESTTT